MSDHIKEQLDNKYREQGERLVALREHVCECLERVKQGGRDMYCWVCYEQMTVLVLEENRARRIKDDMTLELNRSFPMVVYLLDQVHRQKANLLLRDSPRSVPLPLWMLQYVGFPEHLVRVIHLCCRVGHNRGGFLYWSRL